MVEKSGPLHSSLSFTMPPSFPDEYLIYLKTKTRIFAGSFTQEDIYEFLKSNYTVKVHKLLLPQAHSQSH